MQPNYPPALAAATTSQDVLRQTRLLSCGGAVRLYLLIKINSIFFNRNDSIARERGQLSRRSDLGLSYEFKSLSGQYFFCRPHNRRCDRNRPRWMRLGCLRERRLPFRPPPPPHRG